MKPVFVCADICLVCLIILAAWVSGQKTKSFAIGGLTSAYVLVLLALVTLVIAALKAYF